MRVLILMDQFVHLNGAERLGVELGEALNQRSGYSADIASIYSESFSGADESARRLKKMGIPNVYFLGLEPSPSPWALLRAILKLRSVLSHHAYDVVETSTITPAIIAAWATRGIPTQHVAGWHFVYDLKRDRSLKHKLLRLTMRVNRDISFYAISECAKQAWVAFSKTSPERTRVIANGISDSYYQAASERDSVRHELGIDLESRIALFVGRIVKSKGLDICIEALAPLFETQNLYFVCAGPHSSNSKELECYKEILSLVRQIGCVKRVLFLGRRFDVPRLMASSDILVHPTRTEGFGLVLAEALAAGLPIVASNVQGIPEVLKDTDAIMVSPEQPEAVREAVLQTLHRSAEESARSIERGKRRAESFRLSTRNDAMIALFQEVVGRRAFNRKS